MADKQLPGIELFISSEKAVEGAAKFRAAVESAAQAVERIGAVVANLDKLLEQLGAASAQAAAPLKKTGDEAAATGAKVKVTGENAATAGRKLREAGDDADKAGRKFAGLGAVTRALGVNFSTLTGTIGGFLALRNAVAVISETEDRMRILAAVTGATAEQMQRLNDVAEQVSIDGRVSFGDATQTLINLAKSGATAEEAIAALPAVSNLARSGLISMSRAGDIVVQTMAQFGLSISDAARIGDVLNHSADATKSSVESLADSLARVGPAGKELGISLETVTAALARLQQAGIPARVAGTGLAEVFSRLADPVNGPTRAAETIKALNLQLNDVHPSRFGKALQNLAGAGATLADSTAVVGREFDQLLTILTRGREEFEKLELSNNTNATGDSARKAAATVGTLGDSVDKLAESAKRFFREAGKDGLSAALKAVADTGRDALNVLSGNEAAMKSAGVAGKVLAGGVNVGATALAGLVTFSVLRRMGDFQGAMYGAGRAVGSLTAAVRANPIGALISVAVAASTAFSLFGGSVDQTSARLRQFEEDAQRAKAVAEQFDEIRRRAELADSPEKRAAAVQDLTEKLKAQLLVVEGLQKAGAQRVAADEFLGPIQQAAPETISKIRSVMDELLRFEKDGSAAPVKLIEQFDILNRELSQRFGVTVSRVFGEFKSQGASGAAVLKGFDIAAATARKALEAELGRMTKDTEAAKKVFEASARARDELAGRGKPAASGGPSTPDRDRADAITDLIREREREVELARLSTEEAKKAKFIEDLINATYVARRGLRLEEILQLAKTGNQLNANAKAEAGAKRAETAKKVLQDLRNENALLLVQGSAREALKKQQQVLAELDKEKIAKTSEEYQEALKLLAKYKELLEVEEARELAARGSARRDRRHDQLLKNLQDEEQLLGVVGKARDDLRIRLEAENDVRSAGIELSDAEFESIVARRKAINELAEAQRTLGDFGRQAGDAVSNALERIVVDGERARDAMRNLAQELQRIAFRQLVTQNLSRLFEVGGNYVAGLFAGGTAAPTAGPGSATGAAGLTSQSSTFGGNRYWNMLGGVIPAMGGQVLDEFGFLRRAGKTYSFAEGGKSTPEAIMPLERDARGRLGVVAADGGGGGVTINMSFPNIRTAQDARAARATLGQQVRQALAADRRGRRGLRPRE